MNRITDERLASITTYCASVDAHYGTAQIDGSEALAMAEDLRDAREDVETLLKLYRRASACRLCPVVNGCEGGECAATMHAWLDAQRRDRTRVCRARAGS